MKTQLKKASSLTLQQQIKQIEGEIIKLKKQLLKPHLTRSAEQDYNIKSQIIDKQNEIIELYIKLSKQVIKKVLVFISGFLKYV